MYLSASCRNVSEGPATWPPPGKAQQQGVQPTTFPSGKHKGEPDAPVTIESNEGMSTPMEIHWRKVKAREVGVSIKPDPDTFHQHQ
jgi:hypothetical protein